MSFSCTDQVALKAADISHLSCPLPLHKRWLAALEEEVGIPT
jgi:hypothetical protein